MGTHVQLQFVLDIFLIPTELTQQKRSCLSHAPKRGGARCYRQAHDQAEVISAHGQYACDICAGAKFKSTRQQNNLQYQTCSQKYQKLKDSNKEMSLH